MAFVTQFYLASKMNKLGKKESANKYVIMVKKK